MADEDWKKRVGIKINYHSDSDGEVSNCVERGKAAGDTSPEGDASASGLQNNSRESSLDALLNQYEQYGSTPPRTRLSRQNRDWKRREKELERKENMSQFKISRRNTFDAMYFENQDIAESDGEQSQEGEKRSCKRFIKMLRGSERDMKLDLSHPSDIHSFSVDSGVDRAESVPLGMQPAMKIESSKRFMSLTSKLVACHNVKKLKTTASSMNSRQELFNQLGPLLGPEKHTDKVALRQLSNEEFRWQNDMKDLIWLELQAWHASRSLPAQDEFLCKAREEVDGLLNEIMEYHFEFTTQNHHHTPDNNLESCKHKICLSMYCEYCIDRQNTAIRDIEKLSNRLEQAESLFSSSKAFAMCYPLYKDEKFIARVKSMCLWLNMTKQHRLKMLILGKLFICRSQTQTQTLWPEPVDIDSGNGTNGTNTEAEQDSPPVEETPRKKLEWKPSVRFDTEYTGSSPSDSASSQGSTSIYEMPDVVDYSSALATISQQICPIKKDKSSPYRPFIEEVLKTKGLRKSVRFLERLHRYTLVRSCITLEKPSEVPVPGDKRLECVHEEELRRHGFWSQELQEIGLPSYHSSFLFLARIPIRLIQEYLNMRLEQQPEKPSDLCLRQLMRELKEGLRLAVMFRERFESLIIHAFHDMQLDHQDLYEDVQDLDKSSQSVFQIYLDYLQRWCQLVEQESYQKSLLDEEWVFSKQIASQIPLGINMISGRFCCIANTMLRNLGKTLTSTIDALTDPVLESGDDFKDQVTKQSILTLCRELQCVFNDMRERSLKAFNFAKTLKKDVEAMGSQHHNCLDALKTEALMLCKTIKMSMFTVEKAFCITDSLEIDAVENEAVQATIRETLHQGYKFGFEYHKEVCKNVTGEIKPTVARVLTGYAQMWMNFVKHRCEPGRGMRPRWANQGLEYLLIVCDAENTKFLTEEEFGELKLRVEDCTQHIIGKNPDPIKDVKSADPTTRANSPTPRPRFRLPRSPLDPNGRLQTPTRKPSINTPSDGSVDSPSPQERKSVLLYVTPRSRMDAVRTAVDNLERSVDHKLRTQNLIGYVTAVHKEDRVHIRLRQVNFSWQRGIKIGQGSFGKVYTAVNNLTGELMAMKEVQIQPNDHRTIKKIAQELAIFEGIQHKHLVRYYGVEIHRDEMLIFMEFCEEGTLETLVAATTNGLPEPLVRRFTLQMMQAVQTLHCHGIVHRDIKSANIFLTEEGNCLKLGDFGSAVKIKAHTTMPGELQGFVGTQAYMAPEVFTKMHTEGHGRAADIWSVGCVVVEMASGKRPWAELDSNYQVMFKVGMGETPDIPPSLSEEGYDFVDHCLLHDPQQRATAAELLHHTFCKVDGEEPLLSLLPSIIDDYGHFGITK